MTLDPDPLTVPDDDPDAPSYRRGCPDEPGGGAGRVVAAVSRQRPTVEVVTVIRVAYLLGEGLDLSDPVRRVTAYYDLDGSLLFEDDPLSGPPITAPSPEPAPVEAPTVEAIQPVPRQPRAKPASTGGMPQYMRRMLDALVETNGDRTAAAAKLGQSPVSFNGTLSRIRGRSDLTDAERAVLANHARRGKVRVLPDGAPAALPVQPTAPAGETFEERRQRVARERHAQTWRELHPDATPA
jgi:hypothetical protein